MAVVLIVQSLFADGGLTALGLNITNMAVVGVFGGWAVFLLLRRVLPATKASVVVSSGIAAGISVVLAASAFVVEYAVGSSGGVPVGTVLAAMVGVHALIGIGEGVIAALTVGVVLGVRPDLVCGPGSPGPADARDQAGAGRWGGALTVRSSNLRLFLAAGLLVAVGLALVVSGFASSSPDGLEKVAEDKGFLETAKDHLFADGPWPTTRSRASATSGSVSASPA